MFYLIIVTVSIACFTLGFFIISLLCLLLRRKNNTAGPKEDHSVKQPSPQMIMQSSVHPMVQVPVQPGEQPIVKSVAQSERPVAPAVQLPEKEAERALFFTLSRCDVLDHVLEMCKEGWRFATSPVVSEKNNEKMPDFLTIGGWCFGMMFARNEIVFNFILHMSEQTAKLLAARYHVQKASYISEENWYGLTIDSLFINKAEVYAILDGCCDFTLKESVTKKRNDNAQASLEAMKAERAVLEQRMAENISQMEKVTAAAEAEYHAKLEKYKAEHYTKLYITRKEIADYTRGLKNPCISVVERPKQPQLPMSLKYKDKTYAMLHATDTCVLMIVRISADYAASLSGNHPELCRAQFPKGDDWYQLPADGAFANKEAVYQVLAVSCRFIQARQDEIETAEAKMVKR